ARAAGASGEEDIILDDVLPRNTFRLQELEILHQIAHGEICWITLTVVAILLAQLESSNIGNRQNLAAIAAALEDSTNQRLMFPGESAEKYRYLMPLFRSKRAFDRTGKVGRRIFESHVARQTVTLCGDATANLFFNTGRTIGQILYRKINLCSWHDVLLPVELTGCRLNLSTNETRNSRREFQKNRSGNA